MKVTLDPETKLPKQPSYPYLGVADSGRLVLFTSPKMGVVLCEPPRNPHHHIGRFFDSWGESAFSPYNGTVTLSND